MYMIKKLGWARYLLPFKELGVYRVRIGKIKTYDARDTVCNIMCPLGLILKPCK